MEEEEEEEIVTMPAEEDEKAQAVSYKASPPQKANTRLSPPLIKQGWVTAEKDHPVESQGTEIIEEEEEEEVDSQASENARFFDKQLKMLESEKSGAI